MIQSGGVICDIPIFGSILLNIATKGIDLGQDFLDKQIDKITQQIYTDMLPDAKCQSG